MAVGIEISIDPSGAVSGGRTAEASLDRVEKAADKTTKTTGSMSRAMGQAGYQVADLATQISMGGNVMQAFAIQGGQLIQSFNALAGGIFTVAGIVAGVMLPSLFDTDNAADELDETIKKLNTTISVSTSGVATYSKQIEELAAVNERAARAQIAANINDTINVLEGTQGKVSEAITQFDSFFSFLNSNANESIANVSSEFQNLERVMQRTGKSGLEILADTSSIEQASLEIANIQGYIDNLSESIDVSTDQAYALVKAFTDFENNKSPETLQELTDTVNDVNESTGYANATLRAFAQTVNENNLTSIKYNDVMTLLKETLGDLNKGIDENSDSMERNKKVLTGMANNVELLQLRVAGQNREAAIQAALFRSNAEKGTEYYDEVVRLAGAQYDLEQKIRNTNTAIKEYDKNGAYLERLQQQVDLVDLSARQQAILRAEYSLSADATQEQIDKARELAAALYDAREAQKPADTSDRDFEAFITSMSLKVAQDNETLLEELENQRAMIQMYQEYGIGDAQAHADAINRIDRQAAIERTSIAASGFGSLLKLQQAYGDDSSGIYRTLLVAQKTATLASVLMSSYDAIGKAWASAPFPYNLGAVATATVETGALAGLVEAVTPAFATGGMAYGPGTGTSDSFTAKLSNGEFVMPAQQTSRNLATLESMRAGNDVTQSGGDVKVNIINRTTGRVDSSTANWVSRDELTVILNEEVPGIVSSEVNNEYSNTNKSLQRQYVMQRSV